jgi:hypothetical protein
MDLLDREDPMERSQEAGSDLEDDAGREERVQDEAETEAVQDNEEEDSAEEWREHRHMNNDGVDVNYDEVGRENAWGENGDDERGGDEEQDLNDGGVEDEQEVRRPITERRRLRQVVDRFLWELASERRHSVPVMTALVREYGGEGDALWVDVHFRTPLFRLCLDLLPAEKAAQLVQRLASDHGPGLLLKRRGERGTTLLHIAMGSWMPDQFDNESRRRKQLELTRIIVALNVRALMITNDMGLLPVHEACSRVARFDFATLRMLVEMNRATLEVRDNHGCLPLHIACAEIWLADEPLRVLPAVQFLIEEYPRALEARNRRGMTPIMAAVASIRHGVVLSYNELDFLKSMVRRGGSKSLSGARTDLTALQLACVHCPNLELVSCLMNARPLALCTSLTGDLAFVPAVVAPAVIAEARTMFLALVEVLLHDTTEWIVPDPVRERARQVIQRYVPSPDELEKRGGLSFVKRIRQLCVGDSFRWLRSDTLNAPDLQRLLQRNEEIQDLVTGVYRMNMAGRLGPDWIEDVPERNLNVAVSADQQPQILVAAGGNLSCLFLHLRDCPVLFLGDSDGPCACLIPLVDLPNDILSRLGATLSPE